MRLDTLDTGMKATILCVDDEPNILSALKRLLGREGYTVLVAGSGSEGLRLLECKQVDIVISDMRMPEMSGADFLAQARARAPNVLRMLMTGHADINATIAAINRGEIFHYVAKPWNDDELLLVIKHAAERQYLAVERSRLEDLTRQKNEELRTLNASLEAKVEERTAEVRQEHLRTIVANEKLKTGFAASIKVFSNLIEIGDARGAGHSRRVSGIARCIAEKLQMKRNDIQDVAIAALLHDIGKLLLPEALRNKAVSEMDSEELLLYKSHPLKGEQVLLTIPEMRISARLLRAHHERFDGLGFPDGLEGNAIPLGARILAVANDYDSLQSGTYNKAPLTSDAARDYIQAWYGKRYDPEIVDIFMALPESDITGQNRNRMVVNELALHADQIEPGMALSRDLLSKDGRLLLAEGITLDEELIPMIKESAAEENDTFVIHVDGDSIRP